MHAKLDKALERWAAAGLVDAATLGRIRALEAERGQTEGSRWPVYIAVSLGGLMVGAGTLLFVAAHWDDLPPSARFSLVLSMVALFHLSGAAAAERFAALSSVFHAVGTISLGAGISLVGQIFNLEEHWPGGIMMWAAGAWLGWLILRDWPQAALAAILTPAWLAGEWIVAADRYSYDEQVMNQSLLLLALTYFSARMTARDSLVRRALTWIGGIALIPYGAMAASTWWWYGQTAFPPVWLLGLGLAIGLGVPLTLAYALRGRQAWVNGVAAVWVVVLATMTSLTQHDVDRGLWEFFWRDFGRYIWLGIGCVGLIAWGLREARRERINLGVAAFAVTVMGFYFSSVMDKLGRSTSLIGFGVLFLVGGWFFERARRRLIARMEAGA